MQDPFLTYVMPDRTFTHDSRLVTDDWGLQKISAELMYALCTIRKGVNNVVGLLPRGDRVRVL